MSRGSSQQGHACPTTGAATTRPRTLLLFPCWDGGSRSDPAPPGPALGARQQQQPGLTCTMGPGRPRGRGGHETPPRRWAGGPKANKSLELIRALAGPEKPFRRARGQIAAGRTRAAFLTPPRCLLSKQAPPVPFWELHSLAQSPALCHGAESCRGKGRRGAAGEQLPMGTRGVAAFLGCSHPPPRPGAAAARTGAAFTKLLLYPHLGAWGGLSQSEAEGIFRGAAPKN